LKAENTNYVTVPEWNADGVATDADVADTEIKMEDFMKIAIPVNEKTLNSSVSAHFGRAPYFLIYDTETKESAFMDNAASTSRGGAGIKTAQVILDQQANALITPRLGDNAADVLEAAKIEIYKSIEGSAEDNINALLNKKLARLSEIHPGLHDHRNK